MPAGVITESQPLHGVTPGRGVTSDPETWPSVRHDGRWSSNVIIVVVRPLIAARLNPCLGSAHHPVLPRPVVRSTVARQ